MKIELEKRQSSHTVLHLTKSHKSCQQTAEKLKTIIQLVPYEKWISKSANVNRYPNITFAHRCGTFVTVQLYLRLQTPSFLVFVFFSFMPARRLVNGRSDWRTLPYLNAPKLLCHCDCPHRHLRQNPRSWWHLALIIIKWNKLLLEGLASRRRKCQPKRLHSKWPWSWNVFQRFG